MDDKNKEIIDFSNQPLGLMAQEGAQIEEDLNNEYKRNEEARLNVNVQGNPFEIINNEKSSNIQPSINDKTVSSPIKIEEPINNVVSLNTVPVTNPEVVNVNNNQVVTTSPLTEEERKQQAVDELNNVNSYKNENNEEQPPSWGIFVFLILIGVVAGLSFLLKSGKLDSLFGGNDDESETKEVQKQEDNTNLENQQTAETPVQQNPEIIRTFQVKETTYLAAGDTITITSTGVVDSENHTSRLIMTVNYRGLTTRNVEQYYDYSKGISYSNLDIDKYHGWYYDKTSANISSLEELLEHVKSLGESTEVSPGNYKISIAKSDLSKFINDKSEYYDLNKLKDGDVSVEYSLEDGKLKKIRYDLSSLSTDFNKFIVQQDFSNYNKDDSIEIPENVINSAKEFK